MELDRGRIHFLGRFGDSDQQDLVAYIETLWAEAEVLQLQIAELEHSAIKKENTQLRKALSDTNKNYVEVVNENLAIRRDCVKDLLRNAEKRRIRFESNQDDSV